MLADAIPFIRISFNVLVITCTVQHCDVSVQIIQHYVVDTTADSLRVFIVFKYFNSGCPFPIVLLLATDPWPLNLSHNVCQVL